MRLLSLGALSLLGMATLASPSPPTVVFVVAEGVSGVSGKSFALGYDDPGDDRTGVGTAIWSRVHAALPDVVGVSIKTKRLTRRVERYMWGRCEALRARCFVWDATGGAPPLETLLPRVTKVEELGGGDCESRTQAHCRESTRCAWQDVDYGCRPLDFRAYRTKRACLRGGGRWEGKCI